jgi:arginase
MVQPDTQGTHFGETGMTISAIRVPTALGLSPNPRQPTRPRGTWRAPQALESTGLLRHLAASDGGTVSVPPYRFERDSETGIYNREGVASQTRELAALVGAVVDRGDRALVLGGDCSVALGVGLALRRRGRFGLVFIDGHLDFRHLGNSERLRAVAGEDLAIVTGRGLDQHADIDGLRPYFRDADVVALGEREHDRATSDIGSTGIRVVDVEEVRRIGSSPLAGATLSHLSDARDGYWIHLDVDVLASDLMPAVDSPQPGGLLPDELAGLLRELLGGELARGMDVTIYDPELDPDGTSAALLSTMLLDAFAPP